MDVQPLQENIQKTVKILEIILTTKRDGLQAEEIVILCMMLKNKKSMPEY